MIIAVCIIDDGYTEEKRLMTLKSMIAPTTRYSTSVFQYLSLVLFRINSENFRVCNISEYAGLYNLLNMNDLT